MKSDKSKISSSHLIKRVALVYDRVNKWGGAERVLLELHKLFPKADLFTSVYYKQNAKWAKIFKVKTSFLQNFPKASTSHELYALLMPCAFESFSFDKYDLVISVTSEAAKGIVTKEKTLHICYCLTPTRYLWSGYKEYFSNSLFRFLAKPATFYLKRWDKIASGRPDFYIAISKEVQKRIKKYYGKDSLLIYPPLALDDLKGSSRLTDFANDARRALNKNEKFITSSLNERRSLKSSFRSIGSRSTFSSFASGQATFLENNGYFLIVSRLVTYKRIDLAVKAFNKLNLPLIIIGAGSEEKKLKKMANKNIEFLGNLTDTDLISYYKNCIALVFPGVEDFGLAILEAQSFGKPVIAFKGGGALETIVEGKTGLFFVSKSVDSLVKTVKKFNRLKFKRRDCINQARKFGADKFRREFLKTVNKLLKERL